MWLMNFPYPVCVLLLLVSVYESNLGAGNGEYFFCSDNFF
jgi:hypothetical protein